MSSCHSQVQVLGQEMNARRQAWEALALSELWPFLSAGLGQGWDSSLQAVNL